jgi:hypothetical protein
MCRSNVEIKRNKYACQEAEKCSFISALINTVENFRLKMQMDEREIETLQTNNYKRPN